MTDVSRRGVLRLAAAGGVAAATGLAGSYAARAAEEGANPDMLVYGQRPVAVVIGSGFGGSVAALRLAQAGVYTLVLERGQYWHYSPTERVFGNELEPVDASFWFQTKATWPTVPEVPLKPVPGVLQVVQEENITIAAGAAVGGGSVVYSGCTVQPTQKYFERYFPKQVTYSEMNSIYWPRVRAMIGASTCPPDVYQSDPFTHSREFDRQMAAAGYPTTPVHTAFSYAKVRGELNGSLRPSAIVGESTFGNSDGAKTDMSQTYLPAAVATKRVAISPLTEVLSIGRKPNGQYSVRFRKLAADGTVVGTGELTTKLLFLAAGSMGTTKLLLAARETGALPNLDASVGTGWGSNGDAFALRTFSGDPGKSQAAPCVSTYLSESGFGSPIRLENWYATALNGAPVTVQFSVTADDGRATWKYDSSTGQIHLADWTADMNVPAESTAAAFNQMIIDKGLAGEFPAVPGIGGLTGHPLGGAPIGKATDYYGRVKGYPGLYVLDGAWMPGNTGAANPSLTIAAMAERAIQEIIACGG